MSYGDSRKTSAMLGVILISSMVLLLSTTSLEAFSRAAFTSINSVDSLAVFKSIARALCVFLAVFLFFDSRLRLRPMLQSGTLVLLCYYVYALATSATSAIPLISATRAISFIAILFYSSIMIHTFAKHRALPALWDGLFLVFGIFTAITLVFAIVFYRPSESNVSRAAGLYTSNLAASIAGIALCWSWARILRGQVTTQTVAFAGVGLGLLLLTVSRGGILAAFLVCLFATFWRRRAITTGLAAVTTVFVLGLLYSLKADNPAEKVAKYLSRGQDTQDVVNMTGRLPLWKFLLTDQFPKHPVTGVGFQMLSEEGQAPSQKIGIRLTGIQASWAWHPNHAHNSLIQTLIGTGLIGLALFVTGWFLVQRRLWKAARLGDPIAQDAWLILMYIFGHSMVDTILTSTVDPAFVVASILCGVSTAVIPVRTQPVRVAEPVRQVRYAS